MADEAENQNDLDNPQSTPEHADLFGGDDNKSSVLEDIDKIVEDTLRASAGEGEYEDEETDTEKDKKPDGEQADKQAQGDKGDSGGDDQNNAQQQQAQQEQDTGAANTKRQYTGLKQDEKGNLVDAQNNVIIPAGATRRFFDKELDKVEQHVKAKDVYINQLEGKVNEFGRQISEVKALDGIPQKLGLNPQESAYGLDIIAKFKQNPEQTVSYILKEAAALGVDVQKLVTGKESDFNMQAVNTAIQNAVQPLTQSQQRETQETQLRNEAMQEYNKFVAKYPDALTHDQELGKLMKGAAQMGQSMTAEIAYFKLKDWFSQRGLDFAKPLSEQQHLLNGQGAQQPGPQGQPNQGQTPARTQQDAPLTPGRGGNNPGTMQQTRTTAEADDDWDDIIGGVMQ